MNIENCQGLFKFCQSDKLTANLITLIADTTKYCCAYFMFLLLTPFNVLCEDQFHASNFHLHNFEMNGDEARRQLGYCVTLLQSIFVIATLSFFSR